MGRNKQGYIVKRGELDLSGPKYGAIEDLYRFNVKLPPLLVKKVESRAPEMGDRNRVIRLILEAFWDAPLSEILMRRENIKR